MSGNKFRSIQTMSAEQWRQYMHLHDVSARKDLEMQGLYSVKNGSFVHVMNKHISWSASQETFLRDPVPAEKIPEIIEDVEDVDFT
jgi:hypothetical protein